MKHVILIIAGLLFGVLAGVLVLFSQASISQSPLLSPLGIRQSTQKQVIGFLPYWLLDKARSNYSDVVTTLTYFALRIDKDGSILKQTTPTQEEPGWNALESGRAAPFFQTAQAHHLTTSLALDSGDANAIGGLISQPILNAQHLVSSVLPIMHQYGFTDLNLDIEYTAPASSAARLAFTRFVESVRRALPADTTLTVEISTLDVIKPHLIDVKTIADYVDHIVLMAYDYHTPDSFVTGPVAPLSGAGISSEYDVTTAVAKALQLAPAEKIVLGIPLYGYEWETLTKTPRTAVIPGSGVLASTNRVDSFLASCATCSAQVDSQAQESYVAYFNTDTTSTHMLFFPTQASTQAKIQLVQNAELGGLALWALGYENDSILLPLRSYKQN